MKTYLIAGAMLALTAGAASAQAGPGQMGGRLDANGDGKVTLAEFKAGRPGMQRLDTNKDGKISKAEFAARPQRKAPPEGKAKGDGSRMFGMLDANNDGFIDKAELDTMAEKRFSRMDADGDGVLSATELQAARQGARGMMGGGK